MHTFTTFLCSACCLGFVALIVGTIVVATRRRSSGAGPAQFSTWQQTAPSSGWSQPQPQSQICSSCGGSGTTQCYQCSGGYVMENGQMQRHNLCGGTGRLRCMMCGGSGHR